jgi:hypothetical protein
MVLTLVVGEPCLGNSFQESYRLQPNDLFLEQGEHVQQLPYDDQYLHLVP